jgi:N-dimethylarginine dimethylaminohydrolase
MNTDTCPVKIYSEFQPLEEMIVGRTFDASAYAPIQDLELRETLQKIAWETEEDLQTLCETLQQHGVIIKRPKILFDLLKEQDGTTKMKMIDMGYWKTGLPTPPLWPRDLSLIAGNKILSTYARVPARWVESQHFYDIFYDYFLEGADWRALPPPLLKMNATSYADYEKDTMLFHAACFLKCGRDIFHTLPANRMEGGRGTEAALRWIKQQLGDQFRFHEVQRIGHLDGKIALIKPGLLMSWIPREELPPILQKWDIIFLEKKGEIPADYHAMRGKILQKEYVNRYITEWMGNIEETYFDVNVISINENLVLLNGENSRLEKQLNSHGVKCINISFRHRFFWDGGLHCVTLDTRRQGNCEDYFS